MATRIKKVLLIAVIFCLIDWATKAFAAAHLSTIVNPEPTSIWLLPVAIISPIIFMWKFQSPLAVAACGLLSGGVMGNVIERNVKGPVIDFIPSPDLPIVRNQIYNIADVCIVTGCAVTFLLIGLFYLREWQIVKSPILDKL